MSLIVSHMRWIMLVSGVLTMTMLYAAIAPQAMLRSSFGETLDGPLAEVVVRNWGALIALGGGLLVYGAYHVEQRPPILVFTALGKAVFIGLVLAQGQRYLGQQAVVAVVLDSVMIVLFAWYLLAVRGSTRPTV
jgi:nucleoside recognition membrane protein YjiH